MLNLFDVRMVSLVDFLVTFSLSMLLLLSSTILLS